MFKRMHHQATVPPLLPLSPPLSSTAQFLLGQKLCRASSTTVEIKPADQAIPRQVAEEICKHFKNCLPHTHGESELHRAAFEGDAETLHQLLEQIDSDPYKYETINQRNRLGCTPIRLAATGGHLECLTHLINSGASIDTTDVKCQTPLFVAVKNRRLDCARKLLQAGACPDGDAGNSSTPLYVAFMNRDIQYVMLLLEHGAHPDKLRHKRRSTQNMYNPRFTCLDAATECMFADEDMFQAVEALLKRGCETENFCYHTRFCYSRIRVISFFYNFGVQVNVGDLDQWLEKDLTGSDLAKQTLDLLRGTPRSLLSACRIVIISCLPRPRSGLQMLDRLPLPASLISYLKFCDV